MNPAQPAPVRPSGRRADLPDPILASGWLHRQPVARPHGRVVTADGRLATHRAGAAGQASAVSVTATVAAVLGAAPGRCRARPPARPHARRRPRTQRGEAVAGVGDDDPGDVGPHRPLLVALGLPHLAQDVGATARTADRRRRRRARSSADVGQDAVTSRRDRPLHRHHDQTSSVTKGRNGANSRCRVDSAMSNVALADSPPAPPVPYARPLTSSRYSSQNARRTPRCAPSPGVVEPSKAMVACRPTGQPGQQRSVQRLGDRPTGGAERRPARTDLR